MRISAWARELKEPERSRNIAKVRLYFDIDPLNFEKKKCGAIPVFYHESI